MKRVVLIGSESTGKTTLAQRLGQHYGVSWVPEFVREYAARKNGPLVFADHGPIARGQLALEDEALRRAAASHERLLIQDTDLLSTSVYCEHYYGTCPRWLEDEAARRRPDLYLLLDIDLPWSPDPQRDRGHMRPQMHALFQNAVGRSGAPFVLVTGDGNERFHTARAAIDALLAA